jgi:hypothetical protein
VRSLPQSDTWIGTDDTEMTPHVTMLCRDVIANDTCTRLREMIDTYLALGYITSIIHCPQPQNFKSLYLRSLYVLKRSILILYNELKVRHHVCSVGSVPDASQKTPRNMEEHGFSAEFDIICRHHYCGHCMAGIHTHKPTTHPKTPTENAPEHAQS